jgi:hypothetical protein
MTALPCPWEHGTIEHVQLAAVKAHATLIAIDPCDQNGGSPYDGDPSAAPAPILNAIDVLKQAFWKFFCDNEKWFLIGLFLFIAWQIGGFLMAFGERRVRQYFKLYYGDPYYDKKG